MLRNFDTLSLTNGSVAVVDVLGDSVSLSNNIANLRLTLFVTTVAYCKERNPFVDLLITI